MDGSLIVGSADAVGDGDSVAVGDTVAVFEGFGEGDNVMFGWGEAVRLAGAVYVGFGMVPPQPANSIIMNKVTVNLAMLSTREYLSSGNSF